jgi:chromosome segregation ATPase
MGWGLTIDQDEHGFIQIPDADFFTDESDYEGIPPHAYDLIYEYMNDHYRRDIDMARDEGSLEFARETARESFESAKHSCDGDFELHKEKVKELKAAIKEQTAIINKNKPLIKKTKEEIDIELIKRDTDIKKFEKEIDELKQLLDTKEKEYEALVAPIVELEDKLKSYKEHDEEKAKLQRLLDRELEWAK